MKRELRRRGGAGKWVVRSLALTGLGALLLGLTGWPQPTRLLYLPTSEWERVLDEKEDVAYAVAVDASGAAVVVGTSEIVKYAPEGTTLWRRTLAAPARAVALDPQLGDVLVAGENGLERYTSDGRLLWHRGGAYRDVVWPEEGPIVALTADGVLKLLEPDGRVLRELDWGEAFTPEAEARALALGPFGLRGVAVVGEGFLALWEIDPDAAKGRVQWRIDYVGTARDAAFTSGGLLLVVGDQGVEAYETSTGKRLWRAPFPGESEPQAVATVSPSFEEALERGLTDDVAFVAGAVRRKGEEDWDFLTAKYTATGELLWSVPHDGGYGDDVAFGVAAQPGPPSRIYVTGFTSRPQEESASSSRGGPLDRDYLTVVYRERVLRAQEGGPCPGQRPQAGFEAEPPAPAVGEFVRFSNTSTDPDGWVVGSTWDFGDGITSQAHSPTHVYARPGVYTVTLTVVDNAGCVAQVRRTVEVREGLGRLEGLRWEAEPFASEITADFAWTVTRETRPNGYPLGYTPPPEPTDLDTVHFADLSTSRVTQVEVRFDVSGLDPDGTAVLWEWDFGDGTTATFPSPQSPVHVYEAPGSYTVRVTITDAGGRTRVVEETLTFASDPLPLLSWEWDLDGDALVDAFGQNPSFDYPDDGLYPVTLRVEDALGNTASVTQSLRVVNVPPQPDFLSGFLGFPELIKIGGFLWRREANCTPDARVAGTARYTVTMPPDSGGLSLADLSADSEPWGAVTGVSWAFSAPAPVTVQYLQGSDADPEPIVLLLNDLGRFYRGPVDVTLTTTDDDGDSWSTTQTLFVDNIPPCAAFVAEVTTKALSAALNCEVCVKQYGRGDEYVETKADLGLISRTIRRPKGSESCPKFNALCGPSEAVTYGFEVTLSLNVRESLTVTEAAPPGWGIDCATAKLLPGLSCTPTEISGTLLKGGGEVVYTLKALPGVTGGPHTIQGTFSSGKLTVTLDSDVVVCDLARLGKLEFSVDALNGVEWLTPAGGDWNGDALVGFDWFFTDSLGNAWTATGERPTGGFCSGGLCTLTAVDVVCDDTGWRYDVDVELTVADEGGAVNTRSASLSSSGPCR